MHCAILARQNRISGGVYFVESVMRVDFFGIELVLICEQLHAQLRHSQPAVFCAPKFVSFTDKIQRSDSPS